jgi:predicted RNA-binding protein YlqC (UPF0109 family)
MSDEEDIYAECFMPDGTYEVWIHFKKDDSGRVIFSTDPNTKVLV